MVVADLKVLIMAVALLIALCVESNAGSSLMDAKAQVVLPKQNLFDPLPKREQPAMRPDELAKMKKDLNATRDRVETKGRVRGQESFTLPRKQK